jgi:hypothetical protein
MGCNVTEPVRAGKFNFQGGTMTRRIAAGLALLALAACGKGGSNQTAQADSLNRDLQLAPADSTMALNDKPAQGTGPAPAPAPAPTTPKPTPAPAPKPAAPKVTYVTIPAGTVVHLTSNDSLHSRHDKAGKIITANVAEDVKDAKGNVGIPAGAVVTFVVVTLEPAKSKSAKDGQLVLSVKDVTENGKSIPMSANVDTVQHTLQGQGVTAGGAARVGGGAVGGAVVGKIIGGKTGAIIGGIAGAAAGTAVAVETADRDVVVVPGAKIVITLAADVVVQK